jgi:outer membrane immunogenic protein
MIAATTTAMAQGRPFSWTGFYIGAHAGGTWGDAVHTFDNGAPTGNSHPNGGLVGAHAGYNFQSGNLVFSLEGDIEKSTAHGAFANPIGITSAGAAEQSMAASLRGRFGIAADRTLFYVTAGWTTATWQFRGGPAGLPPTSGYRDRLSGWTAGLGLEYAFTSNLTLRVEYRYADYGSARGSLAPAFAGVTMPVDLIQHSVRSGITFKF